MALLNVTRSALLMVDFQARLMPAIDRAEAVIAEAAKLSRAAALLDVPVIYTEQLPDRLGATIDDLKPSAVAPVIAKAHFDASRSQDVIGALPDDVDLVIAGCEAHVCVLQTALGLTAQGYRVTVIANATGSRRADDHTVAMARLAQDDIQIATTEMVIFEWLESAEHPQFRDVLTLVK